MECNVYFKDDKTLRTIAVELNQNGVPKDELNDAISEVRKYASEHNIPVRTAIMVVVPKNKFGTVSYVTGQKAN